jgi:hypothetical protein
VFVEQRVPPLRQLRHEGIDIVAIGKQERHGIIRSAVGESRLEE